MIIFSVLLIHCVNSAGNSARNPSYKPLDYVETEVPGNSTLKKKTAEILLNLQTAVGGFTKYKDYNYIEDINAATKAAGKLIKLWTDTDFVDLNQVPTEITEMKDKTITEAKLQVKKHKDSTLKQNLFWIQLTIKKVDWKKIKKTLKINVESKIKTFKVGDIGSKVQPIDFSNIENSDSN
jgi:hypothetical protein